MLSINLPQPRPSVAPTTSNVEIFLHSPYAHHRLVNGASTLPLFLASEGVHGAVTVKADALWSLRESDSLCFELIGYVSSSVREPSQIGDMNSRTRVVFERKILHLSMIRPSNVTLRRSGQKEHSFAFHFLLPQSFEPHEGADTTKLCPWNALPSSVVIAPKAATTTTMHAEPGVEVEYLIKVSVLRSRKVLGTAVQRLAIFDSTPETPPLCTTDFPGEYTLYDQSSLKRGVFQRCGTISVASPQPSPFEFTEGLAEAMTQIRFMISAQGGGFGLERSLLEDMELDVKWRLQTVTFFSVSGFSRIPTAAAARPLSTTLHKVKHGKYNRTKLRLSSWKEGSTDENGDSLSTTASVWLTVPAKTFDTPTFSTPHLVRKYSIQISLQFRGTVRAELTLGLPCQVQFSSRGREEGAPPNISNRDASSMNDLLEGFSLDETASLPLHSHDACELPIYTP